MILEKRIPIKFFVDMVKWDLISVSVLAILVFFFRAYIVNLCIPIPISGFLGTSIAILLSFKLSQSYDRWWEARKIWGAIVNDSRTLTLQLINFSMGFNGKIVERMALRQIAWCFALSYSLRGQGLTDQLRNYLNKMEFSNLDGKQNIPLALLNNHSKDLAQIKNEQLMTELEQVQIDNTLIRLCTSMGQAERIKNTIFPKTYRITLTLFIYLFLIILAFSIFEIDPLIASVLLVTISIPFFTLQNIAFIMQNPFENQPLDIPMTRISRTIEKNILELLNKSDFPVYDEKDSFYVL